MDGERSQEWIFLRRTVKLNGALTFEAGTIIVWCDKW
jgi:hypothetical protein